MSQSVLQIFVVVVAVFTVKVIVRAHMIKMILSTVFSELLIPWQPNLVWWYITISQNVLWKKWITAFRSKGQNVNVCPDDIFWTTKDFISKLGIVMHHYDLECHAKRLICYFQGQGPCKSSYDQNMTISTVSVALLFLLLSNLVW